MTKEGLVKERLRLNSTLDVYHNDVFYNGVFWVQSFWHICKILFFVKTWPDPVFIVKNGLSSFH